MICHVRRHLAQLSPVRLVGGAQPWPHLPASLGHSSELLRGRLGIRDNCWVFFAYKKIIDRTDTRTRERKSFSRYEQFEISPETIEQELRPAVC